MKKFLKLFKQMFLCFLWIIEKELQYVEYFNSIDEIPEISDEELEALAELGEIEEVENMKYGNPADLSYQETIIEMYNDIEINNLDEDLFKIIEE